MDLIFLLDLASVILSFIAINLIHKTEKCFERIISPAFVIFSAVSVLALALAILEILGYAKPDPSISGITLHLFILAILVLIIAGMSRIGFDVVAAKNKK